jgi:malate permease and related proteins
MLGAILAAVTPVLVVVAIGFFWVRSKRPFETAMLTPLVVDVGTPCLVLATFLKTMVRPSDIAEIALASTIALICFAIGSYGILLTLRLRVRTFLPSLTFPNNGNLGLPLAAYAFGPQGLGYAIVFYAICMIGQFTVGQAIAAGASNFRAIFRLPLLYATAIGVILSATRTSLPIWLLNTIQLIGGMTIPLMLLMLGASLARLPMANISRALLLSAVRIGMGAAVGILVVAILRLDGIAASVLIMQCAMPVAVYNYLFAQKWNNQPDEVAGLVVASTLVSILSIPAVLYFTIH